MNNVSANLEKVCSGCGLCESICPVDAIKVVECNGFLRPRVGAECIECGKCIDICPGRIETNRVSYQMFKYIYYGHSNNQTLRKEAAAGAVTTELIKHLLDADIVDYVITSGVYQCDKNLGFVIIDKANIKSLDEYSGSNYCPSNIGRAIRMIKEKKGRYAVVCLPCLARGINSARKIDKLLDSRIKYVITLLCNHVPSYEATDYLIKRYKVSVPKKIKYRGNGWFGSFRAYNNNNGDACFSVPYTEYFGTKFTMCFWQRACVNCVDHFGIYADVCMGDADFVKYRINEENDGETIVFSNNTELVDIIQEMNRQGVINLFSDISHRELDWIYGPLSDEHKDDERMYYNRATSVLRKEHRDRIIERIRKMVSVMKRRLYLVKERLVG